MSDSTVGMKSMSVEELTSRIQTLTIRENEVLDLILKGLSNDQIALTLVRSPKTIDKHAQRIYRKLGINRRVHLVRICFECGYSGKKSVEKIAPAPSDSTDTQLEEKSYSLVESLLSKGRAWDQLVEFERMLAMVSGPSYFGAFVCALAKVFNVKFAGITECKESDVCGTVIAYSEYGELVHHMDEYEIEGTPCKNTLRDGRYMIPEGACSVFPSDDYLTDTGIESYAGVRLEDRILGTLGLIWICDVKPMSSVGMQLEVLGLIAPTIAAELAVQVALDQAGE